MKKPTALVVQSGNPDMKMVELLLASLGVQLEKVPNSVAFGKALERTLPPDVVLVDLDDSSFVTSTTVAALRSRWRDTLIFVLSRDPEKGRRAEAVGADEFIPKPVNYEDLRKLVEVDLYTAIPQVQEKIRKTTAQVEVGTLSPKMVAAVLMIMKTNRSGAFRHGYERGVYFAGGKIVHAQYDDRVGEAGLARVLAEKQPEMYRFHPREIPRVEMTLSMNMKAFQEFLKKLKSSS